MTAFDAVRLAKGSLIKARRLYIRHHRWFHDEWYWHWPAIAAEWNSAAVESSGVGQR